jgi:hypothetical protein
MEQTCHHNKEVLCDSPECQKCGWNPEVVEKRLEEFKAKIKDPVYLEEQRFKIPFTGYCEVYAHSKEEALAMADNGDMFYVEYDFGDPDRVKNLVEEEEDAMD